MPEFIEVPIRRKIKYGYFLVDIQDAHVAQYSWSVVSGGYLATKPNGRKDKSVLLHRFIMQPPGGKEIDHINGNKLDNRRSNLRICSRADNSHNIGPHLSRNKSGFKGVSKRNNKWRAGIYTKGRSFHLGYFHTAKEAAKVYDQKAQELWGEFAWLNFPKGV